MDILKNEDFEQSNENSLNNNDHVENLDPAAIFKSFMQSMRLPDEIIDQAQEIAKNINIAAVPLTPEMNEQLAQYVGDANLNGLAQCVGDVNLNHQIQSIMSGMPDLESMLESLGGMGMCDEDEPITEDPHFLHDPFFFKAIPFGKYYKSVAPELKLGKLEPVNKLVALSAYKIYGDVKFKTSLYDDIIAAGYTGVILVKETENYSIVKIGGAGKATLYLVLFEMDNALAAYIPTASSPIIFDEAEEEGFCVNHEKKPVDYVYSVEQEMKTIFRYNKKSGISLHEVGTVVVGCETQDDPDLIRFGRIAFEDTPEARLVKKDLELSEDATETDIYFQLIDPESGVARTLNQQESMLANEYLKHINLYNHDGSECLEGRLNQEDVSRNIKVSIKNSRLVMQIEIGRISFEL